MPTVKIENKSGDDIVITLDSEEKELADGESIFFENREKGAYTVLVHRKRVPKETVNEADAPKGLEAIKEKDSKPGSHVQLDSAIKFEVNASKAVLSVVQDIKGVETLHEDVIFVGYTADISGAKLISKSDCFANNAIRKTYISQQIKGAFLPVGLVGILVLLVSGFLLILSLCGTTVKINSVALDVKRAALIFTGGVLVTGYFAVSVYKIRKRAKDLWKKNR